MFNAPNIKSNNQVNVILNTIIVKLLLQGFIAVDTTKKYRYNILKITKERLI